MVIPWHETGRPAPDAADRPGAGRDDDTGDARSGAGRRWTDRRGASDSDTLLQERFERRDQVP